MSLRDQRRSDRIGSDGATRRALAAATRRSRGRERRRLAIVGDAARRTSATTTTAHTTFDSAVRCEGGRRRRHWRHRCGARARRCAVACVAVAVLASHETHANGRNDTDAQQSSENCDHNDVPLHARLARRQRRRLCAAGWVLRGRCRKRRISDTIARCHIATRTSSGLIHVPTNE